MRGLPALLAAAVVTVAAADDGKTSADAPLPADPEGVETVEVVAELPVAADVAAFATQLDAGELRRRGSDLGDLLRRVPGARVRDYGGLSRYATVSLRGSTAEQVTVLLDGIPQNRALGGPVDLSFLPATHLESVTVFRGFAPATLGLGGVGGLVDVRTTAPGDAPQGQVDLVAGELSTVRLSTGWSTPAGERGAIRLGAEWLDTEGDFTYLDTRATLFDPSDDLDRARVNNDLRDASLFLQGRWDVASGDGVRFSARYQDRKRGVPGLDSFPSEDARLDEGLSQGQVSWVRSGSGRLRELKVTADGFAQTIRFLDLEGELGVGVQDQTTRIRGGGVAATLRVPVARHGLLARVDLRREEVSVMDRAIQVADRGGARRDLMAVTVEDVITAGRVIIAPAVRWEGRQDDFVAGGDGTLPPPAADIRESLWSGKVGIAVRLGAGCSARGSAGTFFRTPNLLELFGDRGSVRGNPRLRPEEGRSAEAGVACQGESAAWDWSLEAVGFGRDTDALILFVPNSQGTAVARNLMAARVRGLEGMVGLRWRGWSLDASATLQRARDESEGFTAGNALVGIPDRLGYLGVAWGTGRFGVRWDVAYVGANSTDLLDTPDLRLPARVLHDLNVWWEAGAGFRLGLDVQNVFDWQTRDVARFPLPGRVAFVHVGWRMGA